MNAKMSCNNSYSSHFCKSITWFQTPDEVVINFTTQETMSYSASLQIKKDSVQVKFCNFLTPEKCEINIALAKEINGKESGGVMLSKCFQIKLMKIEKVEWTVLSTVGKLPNYFLPIFKLPSTNKFIDDIDNFIKEIEKKDEELENIKKELDENNQKMLTLAESVNDEKNRLQFVTIVDKIHKLVVWNLLHDVTIENIDLSDEETMSPILTPEISIVKDTERFCHVESTAVVKIQVEDKSISFEDLDVHIEAPTKTSVGAHVFLGTASGIFGIKFLPMIVGTHEVKIFIKNTPLSITFQVEVFDTRKIKILDIPESSICRQKVIFNVDLKEAGKGILDVVVSNNQQIRRWKNVVGNQMRKLSETLYEVSFIPILEGTYDVQIILNEVILKNILDFTFQVPVLFKNPLNFKYSYNQFAELPCEIFIENSFCESALDIKGQIEGPNGPISSFGKEISPCFSVLKFIPTEIGFYKVKFNINGRDDPTTCLLIRVLYGKTHADFLKFDLGYFYQNKIVLPINKSLCTPEDFYYLHILKLEDTEFLLDFSGCTNGGSFKLDVEIRNSVGKKVPAFITGVSANFKVEFTPTSLGDLTITVKYNGELVK